MYLNQYAIFNTKYIDNISRDNPVEDVIALQ